MSLVKYRLKEVAADFGTTPKEISDIISRYYEKPKSNTQVLTDEELNAVFDYMTQKHPIDPLEPVSAAKKPKPPKAAPQPQPQAAPAPQQQGKPQQPGNQKQGPKPQQPQQQPKPQPQPQQAQQPPKPKNTEPERKRERRVVDTSAVQVNANRFADVDNLVSERVQDYQGGKQRIGGGKGKQQQKQQQNNKFKGN